MHERKLAILLLTGIALCGGAHAQTLQTTSFISAPQHFNGFEGFATSPLVVGGRFPNFTDYSEGGITVRYIDNVGGRGPIVTSAFLAGAQGSFSWYEAGGTLGYTRITLTSGADFESIQFLAGSGYGSTGRLEYQLLLDGAVVSTGSTVNVSAPMHYVGFSGGGFDEVLVQATSTANVYSFSPTNYDALVLDSIAAVAHGVAPVPEPETYAMLLAGLALLGLRAKRRRTLRAGA